MKKRVRAKHERRKRHKAADKPPKSPYVFVCRGCTKFINGREAYLRNPVTGRADDTAWCTACYEREVNRATQARTTEPRRMEKLA